jgi:hypothetical protein
VNPDRRLELIQINRELSRLLAANRDHCWFDLAAARAAERARAREIVAAMQTRQQQRDAGRHRAVQAREHPETELPT